MALDAPKSQYAAVAFTHSSSEAFSGQYLHSYGASSSYLGISKTRPSEINTRHSSRRMVSQSHRSRSEQTFQTSRPVQPNSVSQDVVQKPPSSPLSSPQGPTHLMSDVRSESQHVTPSPNPTHASTKNKYGTLRGRPITDTESLSRSQSQYISLVRTQSTSGSASDVGSSPKAHTSFWHAHFHQGSSVSPHSSSMSQRKLSNPHIRSGSISDGSIAVPVDLKRLLSKPALPSSSPGSLFSDSDSQHGSLHGQRLTRSTSSTRETSKISRGPSTGPSRLEQSPNDRAKQSSDSPTHVKPGPKSVTEPAVSTSGDQKLPKARYLIKRRPSLGSVKVTSTPIPPIPTVPPIDETKLRHSPTSTSVVRSASRSPRTPDMSKLGSPRHHSNVTGSLHTSASPLTPAGAVAEAYKQQEARREDLALASQSGNIGMGRTQEVGAKIDDNAAPYYTVLGSTTGKVLAVGGPGDDDWDLKLEAKRSTEERLRLPSSSKPQTLSKKISGKWRKVAWGRCDAGHLDNLSTSGDDPLIDSRPSLHELWRANNSQDEIKSLRLSIEKLADMSLGRRALQSLPPNRTWSELPQPEQQISTPRRVHSEMLSGGKVWRLMKRISGGSIREKYQRQESPPPVPALPFYHNGSGSQDGHDGNHPGMASRFMQSRTSMSGARPLSRNPSPSLEPSRRAVLMRTLGHGTSATTSSSSPSSSVVAFARSQRSSSSSDAGDLSPSHHVIAQHIISPSELYLFDADHDTSPKVATPPPPRTKSGRPDDWISHSPEIAFTSLPYPPVRPPPVINREASPARTPSPAIPSFSTTDAINTFGSRMASPGAADNAGNRTRPSLTVFTPSSTPPPRPPRNPKRTLSISRSASTSATRKLSETVLSALGNQDAPTNLHRRKTSSDIHNGGNAVARTRRRSNSLEALSRRERKMTMTFRGLGEATTPTLTEQEKTNKWDDLLARSARAGGTLHIGGDELASDHLRLSNESGVTFGQDKRST